MSVNFTQMRAGDTLKIEASVYVVKVNAEDETVIVEMPYGEEAELDECNIVEHTKKEPGLGGVVELNAARFIRTLTGWRRIQYNGTVSDNEFDLKSWTQLQDGKVLLGGFYD